MNKEEIKTKIQEIGTLEDVAEIRGALADFQSILESDYDVHSKTSEELEKAKTDNEKLRTTNMQLFLQVGDKGNQTKQKEPTEKRKFENLFDEKGGLK